MPPCLAPQVTPEGREVFEGLDIRLRKAAQMTASKQFNIGLVLGGTVSTGAYSAGVLDFLNEALNRYYEARKDGAWQGPKHQPVIRVISGTSGGSVTALVYLFSLAAKDSILPVRLRDRVHYSPSNEEGEEPENARDNLLYQVWVKQLTLGQMLAPALAHHEQRERNHGHESPLSGLASLSSILNSESLINIGQQILDSREMLAGRPQVPYITQRLDVFMTTTNLNGVSYGIPYSGSTEDEIHYMKVHADHQHFILEELGDAETFATSEAERQKRIPAAETKDELQYTPYPSVTFRAPGDKKNWKKMLDAALASSTIPLAFKPFKLSRPYKDYLRINAKISLNGETPIPNDQRVFEFMNIDGGVFDNEPQAYASSSLWGHASHEQGDPSTLDRAIIMIDPFTHSFGDEREVKPDILSSLYALASALVNQGSFALPASLPRMVPDPTKFRR